MRTTCDISICFGFQNFTTLTLSVTSRAPLAKALSLSSNLTLKIFHYMTRLLGVNFKMGGGPVVDELIHDRIAVFEVLPAL